MLTIKQFFARQYGQSMVEYVLIISLIAIGILAALQGFGNGVQGLYATFPAAF